MPALAIIIGALLTVLGVFGYLAGGVGPTQVDGVAVEAYRSRTALIPAIPGLLILLCGAVASARPSTRKHAMHVAVAVALLGAIFMVFPIVIRVVPGLAGPLTIISVVGSLILCLIFVVAGVRSFMAVRRDRQRGFEIPKR